MKIKPSTVARPFFLGIEGGGTRTVALLADAQGRLIHRAQAGPANLKLSSEAQLASLFRSLRKSFPAPDALGIGLAGVRDQKDRARVLNAAALVWRGVPCTVTNDLETALNAADPAEGEETAATVLILSGTGSCCFGKTPDGRISRIGGWGHLIGDKGSGYEIGLRALKAVVYYYDRDAVWSLLGARILTALVLNEPNDLIDWSLKAGKSEIAALALEVFEAWKKKDKIASDILEGAAHSLARDGVHCARRLVPAEAKVRFILAGGVLLKQPRFAAKVEHEIKKMWRSATVAPLTRESAWGAVRLAQQSFGKKTEQRRKETPVASPVEDFSFARSSPTEARNPRSKDLDRLSLARAIQLMLDEESKVPAAIWRERKQVEQAIRMIVRALGRHGRLFYVGAGTSGRLGVLDASECPPTFRTRPEQVQGIIAGGQTALWRAVEGAEDDAAAGSTALRMRRVKEHDVVVGIAASGRMPFVWGALREAKRVRAKRILICFNPKVEIPRDNQPDMIIAPNVGPEVLTGSTRLKCGTATKLILNLLTTLAMVRLGKVASNLMIDLDPTNSKLRDRAARIVSELTGCDYAQAQRALQQSGWIIKSACQRLSRKGRK